MSDREARLAAALRENLKRRKAQARARQAEASDGRKAADGANPAPDADAPRAPATDDPKDR